MKRLDAYPMSEWFKMTGECAVAYEAKRGEIVAVNSSFCRMLRRPTHQIIGKGFLSLIHPADLEGTEQQISDDQRTGEPARSFANRWLHKDGTYRHLRWTSSPSFNGIAPVIARDVTSFYDREAELLQIAHYDQLTGLPSKWLTQDRFNQAIDLAIRNEGAKLAVGFVDLVRFKEVNDTYGHECGDFVLKSTAQRILGQVRRSDTVCRWGGDEFVLLLTHLPSASEARYILDRIVGAMMAPMKWHDISTGKTHELQVGLSVGLAMAPEDGDNLRGLMAVADHAMYANKRSQHALMDKPQ